MTMTLTCHSCSQVLSAETEDELVDLGQAHAVEHGHRPAPPRPAKTSSPASAAPHPLQQ